MMRSLASDPPQSASPALGASGRAAGAQQGHSAGAWPLHPVPAGPLGALTSGHQAHTPPHSNLV